MRDRAIAALGLIGVFLFVGGLSDTSFIGLVLVGCVYLYDRAKLWSVEPDGG